MIKLLELLILKRYLHLSFILDLINNICCRLWLLQAKLGEISFKLCVFLIWDCLFKLLLLLLLVYTLWIELIYLMLRIYEWRKACDAICLKLINNRRYILLSWRRIILNPWRRSHNELMSRKRGCINKLLCWIRNWTVYLKWLLLLLKLTIN